MEYEIEIEQPVRVIEVTKVKVSAKSYREAVEKIIDVIDDQNDNVDTAGDYLENSNIKITTRYIDDGYPMKIKKNTDYSTTILNEDGGVFWDSIEGF